ncbi:MAG: hypothetical protein KDD47_24785, partial [Acidobacteria bacterium]|nr:hypothetical protein [Acidobacteriota bacterium]
MWRFTSLGTLGAVYPRALVCILCLAALAVPALAAGSGGSALKIMTLDEPQPGEVKGAPGEGKGLPVSPKGVVPPYDPQGLETLGQGFVREVEPNNTSATATPLGGSNVVV